MYVPINKKKLSIKVLKYFLDLPMMCLVIDILKDNN